MENSRSNSLPDDSNDKVCREESDKDVNDDKHVMLADAIHNEHKINNDNNSNNSHNDGNKNILPFIVPEVMPLCIGEEPVFKYFETKTFRLLWNPKHFEYDDFNYNFYKNYNLTSQIGKGGYGQVFYAKRYSDDETVVVKIFNKTYLKEEAHPSIKSFITDIKKVPTEINALIDLQNIPGVIKLLEVYISAENDYILIMEAIPKAKGLHVLIKEKGRLSEAEACHYFKQIVQTLISMYEEKRHHLDIKAANILIDANTGKALLIDFGGAKKVTNKNIKHWVATISMLPPEVHLKKKFYGIPVESWCLGILLLKMTTGKMPTSRDVERNSNRVYLLQKEFSDDFNELLLQCLSRYEDFRPNFEDILESNWIKKYENEKYINENKYIKPIKINYRDNCPWV